MILISLYGGRSPATTGSPVSDARLPGVSLRVLLAVRRAAFACLRAARNSVRSSEGAITETSCPFCDRDVARPAI
ncbi:MAG: hypothetical protein M1455_00060 [Actinobacteria bacterium]|nr:hypothetical protein [Actinomycetota bacterium]